MNAPNATTFEMFAPVRPEVSKGERAEVAGSPAHA